MRNPAYFYSRMSEQEVGEGVELLIGHTKNVQTKKNTALAYNPRVIEYKQFCQAVYGHSEYCMHMSREKVMKFMYYQAMRNKRNQGGKKVGERVDFDFAEYTRIMAEQMFHLKSIQNGIPASLVSPVNPLSGATLNQYRSALWNLWTEQSEKKMNQLQWSEIWTKTLNDLMAQARRRRPQAEKENYVEKVQAQSVPYKIIFKFNEMERAFWDFGCRPVKERGGQNHRVFTWIRHRFVFLFSSHALLRCETLHNGELSDLSTVPNAAQPQSFDVFRFRIYQGKTVKDSSQQYGNVMRHKDVRVCSVGALAMYLASRFLLSGEFQDVQSNDEWLNSPSWFDAKILVSPYSTNYADYTLPIKSSSYGAAVKEVLHELNIPSHSYVHIGRKIGSKALELAGVASADINLLGNWSDGLNTRQVCYSDKMPVNAIMAKAHFVPRDQRPTATLHPTHFNARTTVEVPQVLLENSPLGFSVEAHIYLLGVCASIPAGLSQTAPTTATEFTRLIHLLNVALIQDLAAMMVLEPEREHHPVYEWMPFTKLPQWTLFVATMKEVLDADDPTAGLGTREQAMEIASPGFNDGLKQIAVSQAQNTASIVSCVTESSSKVKREVTKSVTKSVKKLIFAGAVGNVRGMSRHMLDEHSDSEDVSAAAEEEDADEDLEDATVRAILRLPLSRKRRALPTRMQQPSLPGLEPGPRDDDDDDDNNDDDNNGDARTDFRRIDADPNVAGMPSASNTPKPKAKFHSMSSLWKQWHSEMVPLEEKFGKKWRGKDVFTPLQQRQFSRMNQVAQGIQNRIDRRTGGSGTVLPRRDERALLEQLDSLYAGPEMKKNLSKMIKWMQDPGVGLLPPPRGRKQKDNDKDNVNPIDSDD